MSAKIVINTIAVPNLPTDGYQHVRHDTEPNWEDIELAFRVARRLLRSLNDLALYVADLEISFTRGHHPGELCLAFALQVKLPGIEPFEVANSYSHFKTSHMRSMKDFDKFFLSSIHRELREQIENNTSTMNEQLRTNEKLLGSLPSREPQDLY